MTHTSVPRQRITTLLVIIILLLGFWPGIVRSAPLPQSELDAIYGGWVHYKVPGASSDVSCNSNTSLSGKDNANKAYNYLVDTMGLKPHQAAGVVGNLMAESGVMPDRKQSRTGIQTINSVSQIVPEVGFGIAQWTSGGRQEAWKQLGQKEAEKQLDKNATEAERKKAETEKAELENSLRNQHEKEVRTIHTYIHTAMAGLTDTHTAPHHTTRS